VGIEHLVLSIPNQPDGAKKLFEKVKSELDMFASLYNQATSSENILLPEMISGRFVAEAFQRSIGWQCVTTGRYPHGWERDPRRYFRLR